MTLNNGNASQTVSDKKKNNALTAQVADDVLQRHS